MVVADKDITCGNTDMTVKVLKDTDECFVDNPPEHCYNVSKYNYTQTSNVCIKDALTGKNSVDCRNGLAYIACTDKVNKCINDHNNYEKDEWGKRRDAFNSANGPPAQWDKRRSEWVNHFRNERQEHCNGCPGGWEEEQNLGERDCGKGNSKRLCRKQQHVAEQDATNQTNAEKGPKPSFTEGEPPRKGTVQAAPVSCCNNVVNVVGGQIQNTNITQSCLSESSGAGGASGTSTGTQNTNQFNSDGSVKNTEDDEYTGEEEEQGDKKMFMILIVLIVFILCSCVAAVLLISDD